MKFEERYRYLNSLLTATLTKIINGDYHLIDLPYHANIGDILIWEGELSFLKKLPFRLISYSSRQTESLNIISRDEIILFHGGGNVGDLYPEHLDYLLDIVRRYPDNRVVVFPQTVYFKENNQVVRSKLELLSIHKDLHFCVRDEQSFCVMENYLKKLYLLPDMAFCIPLARFEGYCEKSLGSLYMRRVDSEYSKHLVPPAKTDYIRDWPTFERRYFTDGLFLARVLSVLSNSKISVFKRIWNWYAFNIYRNKLIDIGVKFIKSHSPVYSTRLHCVILCLLCRKDVHVLDNNYGKISGFVNTWLNDVNEIKKMYIK